VRLQVLTCMCVYVCVCVCACVCVCVCVCCLSVCACVRASRLQIMMAGQVHYKKVPRRMWKGILMH